MFHVLVGDFLKFGNTEINYGIFDWFTFFIPYVCLYIADRVIDSERMTLLKAIAAIFIVAPVAISLMLARCLFAAVGMILASPFILISHAVFSICLLFKSYRSQFLLKICAQNDEKIDIELVQKLLDLGVNIRTCDAQGRTYLDLLCLERYGKNSSVCGMLLNKAGKFTQQDSLNNCLKSLAWKYSNNGLDLQAHKQFKRLFEFGADPNIIRTDFDMNLIQDVIATESNHDLGILIILNIEFDEIKHLGKANGNCIEKLIHHIAQSGENQDAVLQTLKAQFDNKNIKKIEEMQIKEFCAKFSPKFSKEEGAGIFELLKCGRKMQGDGYKRDNSEAPYLPKLPIGIFGMIAQRMVPKESPALLFEVDSQEICHKML